MTGRHRSDRHPSSPSEDAGTGHQENVASSWWRGRLSFVAAGACAGLVGQAIGLGLLDWPPGGLPGFPWWNQPGAAANADPQRVLLESSSDAFAGDDAAAWSAPSAVTASGLSPYGRVPAGPDAALVTRRGALLPVSPAAVTRAGLPLATGRSLVAVAAPAGTVGVAAPVAGAVGALAGGVGPVDARPVTGVVANAGRDATSLTTGAVAGAGAVTGTVANTAAGAVSTVDGTVGGATRGVAPVVTAVGDVANSTVGRAGQAAGTVVGATGNVVSTAARTAGHVVPAVGRTAADAVPTVRRTAGEVVPTVRRVAGDAVPTVRRAAGGAVSTAAATPGRAVDAVERATPAVPDTAARAVSTASGAAGTATSPVVHPAPAVPATPTPAGDVHAPETADTRAVDDSADTVAKQVQPTSTGKHRLPETAEAPAVPVRPAAVTDTVSTVHATAESDESDAERVTPSEPEQKAKSAPTTDAPAPAHEQHDSDAVKDAASDVSSSVSLPR